MKNLFEKSEINGNDFEVSEIVESILDRYPNIAKELIKESHDLREERNKGFFENPDNPLEHKPEWHQWGIITHTKMFEKFYREEVPRYLEEWEIKNGVDEEMSEEIEGITKGELLDIAIIFHDSGKFTERKFKQKQNGEYSTSFAGHEKASGEIIRSVDISRMLREDYQLTDKQIEYIARCAELHFELGIMRNVAKQSTSGYTIEFSQSEEFKKKAEAIMAQHPDFRLEIGLLFLADSLAKTDVRIEGETEEEAEHQEEAIKASIKEKGLNPKLINAIKQGPVNIAIAREYFKLWDKNLNNEEKL